MLQQQRAKLHEERPQVGRLQRAPQPETRNEHTEDECELTDGTGRHLRGANRKTHETNAQVYKGYVRRTVPILTSLCEQRATYVNAAAAASEVTFVFSRITNLTSARARERPHSEEAAPIETREAMTLRASPTREHRERAALNALDAHATGSHVLRIAGCLSTLERGDAAITFSPISGRRSLLLSSWPYAPPHHARMKSGKRA